jgi:Na+-transporting methylmalonyl-CoA/oxaloacetate decarboxylase gamma subunit
VSDIQVGLVVSGVGLTITFLALALFIGVIVILQKIFPPKTENEVDADIPEEIISDSDETMIAALAAAVYVRSRRSGQLGATLLAGPGPYRTSR